VFSVKALFLPQNTVFCSFKTAITVYFSFKLIGHKRDQLKKEPLISQTSNGRVKRIVEGMDQG